MSQWSWNLCFFCFCDQIRAVSHASCWTKSFLSYLSFAADPFSLSEFAQSLQNPIPKMMKKISCLVAWRTLWRRAFSHPDQKLRLHKMHENKKRSTIILSCPPVLFRTLLLFKCASRMMSKNYPRQRIILRLQVIRAGIRF